MLKPETIQHLADLARLGVSEEEIKKYTTQMSQILGYFKQLEELDTSDVPVTNHITGLENVTRADEVHVPYEPEKILHAAPEIEKQQVKVQAVFDSQD
jgi:aspartyl-tRNA(Asn)/glutamyl-tRNA(Gln) amidotransferase subunit C